MCDYCKDIPLVDKIQSPKHVECIALIQRAKS